MVGGGSAGCAMAAKITNDFPSQKVIVLEPNNVNILIFMLTTYTSPNSHLDTVSRTMASPFAYDVRLKGVGKGNAKSKEED